MTKTSPGPILLLLLLLGALMGAAILGSSSLPLASPPIPPSPITTQAGKACPSACSAQLTATEDKLQAQINQIRDAMNHDIPILDERTQDANRRLKKLESDEEREDLESSGAPIAQK